MYAVRMKGKLCPLRYDPAIKIRQRLINQIDRGSLTTSQVLWYYLYPCLRCAVTRLEQEVGDEDLHYYGTAKDLS